MSVRTRFAPSPTGFLHVGGARTALFNYLFARHHGGDFVLRIEDTDRERSTEESVQAIFDGMQWLGLDYDEEPVRQTSRYPRYTEIVDQLIAQGKAYRCRCSKERLDQVREEQKAAGAKPKYDGHCRDKGHDASEPHVIRLRVPDTGETRFADLVKGDIVVPNAELDDFIMVRTDGNPTYNFTVVVDDIDTLMTHVIRGDDHLSNTPKQIHLYRALGAVEPEFGHLPMILGGDGERLSKRHGAVSVMQYREEGFVPDGLLNYLVRLGWSHGDQEIFSRAEMVELFDLAGVNRAPSRFDMEKARWINQQFLQMRPVEEELAWHLDRLGIEYAEGPALSKVWDLFRERAETVDEIAEQARFLFEDFEYYDEKAAKKQLREASLGPLKALRSDLSSLGTWNPDAIQAVIQGVVDRLEVGFGKVGQPLRVAATGRGNAPANDQVLAALGKQRTLSRLDRAIAVIEQA